MARWRQTLRKAVGCGIFPHQLWFVLECPGRKLLQRPERLADRLHLRADSRVLEIGPGSGFFSVAVARQLPAGHLELLDVQPEMLRHAKRKIEKAGLTNVSYTAADAAQIPLDDRSFDVAFIVAVLGEVQDQSACLREVHRVLRPGGLLSITEHWPDPDFIPHDRLHRLAVGHLFTPEEHFGSTRAYTSNFRRP